MACTSSGSQCGTVPNTSFAGPGIEKFTYTAIVDFAKAPYNKYGGSSCSTVRFDLGTCCRNAGITSGSANTSSYNYASLDLSNGKGNSSPQYTLDPQFRISVNQAWRFNLGAMDTIDNDSISYVIGAPLKSYGNPENYKLSTPVKVYYPGNVKYPYSNAYADPPIGLSLDPVTGNWVCTPTDRGEVSPIIVEVNEWGRDSSGNRIIIGKTRREFIASTAIMLNNTPSFIGLRDYNICEGDSVCFSLSTKDDVKVPPPPTKRPDPDTTTLQWINGFEQASFTFDPDTSIFQSGKFCWETKKGDTRSNPYFFAFEVSDDNCNGPQKTQTMISVRVNPRSYGSSKVTPLSCGKYALEGNWDSTSPKPLRYAWTVYDLKTGKVDSSRKQSRFISSGTVQSNARIDTLDIRQDGAHIIELTLINSSGCGTTYRDTVYVSSRLEVSLSNARDTFQCQGVGLTINPDVKHGGASLSYVWSTGTNASSIQINMSDSIAWLPVRLDLSDASGCKAWDSIVIFKRSLPNLIIAQKVMSCVGDSVLLVAHGESPVWTNPLDTATGPQKQAASLNYEWVLNGKTVGTDSLYKTSDFGNYLITVKDSLGCAAQDTLDYSRYHLVMPLDTQVCYNSEDVNLTRYEDSLTRGGNWSCPAAPKVVNDSVFDVSETWDGTAVPQTFEIYYTYNAPGGNCSVVDSFEIEVNPLPRVELRDGHFCQDKDQINVKDDKIIAIPGGGSLALGRQAWSCVDCGSYDEAKLIDDLGSGLPGAPQNYVLNINDQVIPLGSKKFVYIDVAMRFRNVFGCFNWDTSRIYVHKEVEIEKSRLTVHSSTQPYALCETDNAITLKANIGGGQWTADQTQVIDRDTLRMSMANANDAFYIHYDLPGCNSKDSVQVVVHPKHIIHGPRDTALTAFQDPTTINLKATYKNAAGINWLALTGGSFDNIKHGDVNFTMPGDQDTIRRFHIVLFTDVASDNVCPHVEENLSISLHPTPCTDIMLTYDISGKILRAESSNPNLEKYNWRLGNKTSVNRNPVFDVSDYPGNVALIELLAENGLEDTCTARKWINLKTGSVEAIDLSTLVYPNPVKHGFFIGLPQEDGAQVVVLDMHGRILLDQEVRNRYVNCTALQPGQYLYKIIQGDQFYMGRFVKLNDN